MRVPSWRSSAIATQSEHAFPCIASCLYGARRIWQIWAGQVFAALISTGSLGRCRETIKGTLVASLPAPHVSRRKGHALSVDKTGAWLLRQGLKRVCAVCAGAF